MTQAQSNPYRYSDSNKRYQTYDYYLRRTFGGKVAKLPLDAGFTCPNPTSPRERIGFCCASTAAAEARTRYLTAPRGG